MVHIDTLTWAARLFYACSNFTILAVRLTPAFRDRFLSYGARDAHHQPRDDHDRRDSSSVGTELLDNLATIKVPHSWFIHFYYVSLASAIACRALFPFNHPSACSGSDCKWISISRADLAWLLMVAQSIRRLLECHFLSSQSTSKMWIGHYFVGLAFYVVTNLVIGLELHDTAVRNTSRRSSTANTIYALWLCSLAGYSMFRQNQYHRYLSGLRKYTLPDWGLFKTVICPHYNAECGIYLIFSFLLAPPGRFINWTMFCALGFVMVNLGVTAHGTKVWMLQKFPERRQDVQKRWRMIAQVW